MWQPASTRSHTCAEAACTLDFKLGPAFAWATLESQLCSLLAGDMAIDQCASALVLLGNSTFLLADTRCRHHKQSGRWRMFRANLVHGHAIVVRAPALREHMKQTAAPGKPAKPAGAQLDAQLPAYLKATADGCSLAIRAKPGAKVQSAVLVLRCLRTPGVTPV